MNALKTAGLAGLLSLYALSAAHADPVFRGPAIHDGAWQVTRAWADPAAGPGDPSRGSFAYAYRVWAVERADRHVTDGTLLDCADLSINMLCEYAALNGLPVEWRVYYPPEKRFVNVRNTDAQFDSAESFVAWSQHFLGAMNLADNTYPITYDAWAGGDMVLMDWNQDPEYPNFEGRTVWHTYLIGVPDERIYYGNMDNNLPLPVTSTSSASTMTRVREHPDRYGLSPRRFRLFRGALTPPAEKPVVTASATVIRALRLNLRQGPGTTHPVVGKAQRGQELAVIGRQGRWVQVQLEDGAQAWAHGYYLRVVDLTPAPGLVDLAPEAGLQGGPSGLASSLTSITTAP
jgi:hypothetical protein